MLPFEFLDANPPLYFYLLAWVGISAGMHAFPSSGDATTLWENTRRFVAGGDKLALFGFPIAALIYVANVLRVFWVDLWYALGLSALVPKALVMLVAAMG